MPANLHAVYLIYGIRELASATSESIWSNEIAPLCSGPPGGPAGQTDGGDEEDQPDGGAAQGETEESSAGYQPVWLRLDNILYFQFQRPGTNFYEG